MSRNGSLAFVPASFQPRLRDILWLSERGQIVKILPVAFPVDRPIVSPDGKRLAVHLRDNASDVIGIFDVKSRREVRRVVAGGSADTPVWAGDGTVFYSSHRTGSWQIYRETDGGEAQALTPANQVSYPTSFSPLSQLLVFLQQNDRTKWDIGVLSVEQPKKPRFLRMTTASETFGALSPSGKYLAYVSDESGQFEVYVMALDGRRVWPISIDGGTEPVWDRNGSHLYFRTSTHLMRVAFDLSPDGQIVALHDAETLFKDPYVRGRGRSGFANYDVGPAGEIVVLRESPTFQEIVFVTNRLGIGGITK